MKKSVLMKLFISMVVLVFVIGLSACSNQSDDTDTPPEHTYCKHNDPTKIIIVESKSPTCKETGLTDGMKCVLCGTMVVPQVVVELINCSESDWIIDREATITADGAKHTECTMCGKLMQEEIYRDPFLTKLYEAMPNGGKFEIADISAYNLPSTVKEVYNATNGGYVFHLVTKGYKDGLVILCGVDSNGAVTGAVCLSSQETYGVEQEYGNNFNGVNYDTVSDVDLVAAATSTSRGYHSAIRDALAAALILNSKAAQDSNGLVFALDKNGETYRVIDLVSIDGANIVIPEIYNGKPITSIGDEAFSGCTSLVNVTIPDSVTSIGRSAFYNCTSLVNVTIPDSVTSIGDGAFRNCASLVNVTIPDSVTSIGDGAFNIWPPLEKIYFKGTYEQWESAWSWWNEWTLPDCIIYCTDAWYKSGNVTYY